MIKNKLTPKSDKWKKEFNSERRVNTYDKTINIFALRRTERLKILKSILNAKPDLKIKILELGAGTGILTEMLTEYYPRASIVAIDGSDKMLKEAKSKAFLKVNNHRIKWIVTDLSYHTWAKNVSGPFDLIITMDSLHHLTHKRKKALYQEIYCILVPGGQFIISDHINSQEPYYKDPQYNLWAREVLDNLKKIKKGSEEALILEKFYSWSYNDIQDLSIAKLRKSITAGLKQEGENPMPIMQHIDLMRDIGYIDVVVEYRYSNFSIISAIKEAHHTS